MFNLDSLDRLVFGTTTKPTKKYTPRRIERSGRFWNTGNDDVLRHWFKVRKFSVKECASRSGYSERCIRQQLERLDLTVRQFEHWTGKDDKVLRELWSRRPNGSWCAREMNKVGRTVRKRIKELGLKKPS